ncbi:MAG: NAD(P)/FAD-dependent oxidoreductase [Microbacterium sp.]
MSRTQQSWPRIVIIGGGFGGIAVALELKRQGIESFTVLEAEAGPGGTWWVNTYPGSEVDLVSSLYSLAALNHNWTRTHATQPEILQYIEDVVDRFDLRRHFRFNTRVRDVVWSEVEQQYHLTTEDGQESTAQIVVSAVGTLSDPKPLDWPGVDSFRGRILHSQRWDHSLDLTGKRVAVIGVGSTASQIVPAIAPIVERLTIFQREPGWVLPKNARDYTPREMRTYSSIWRRRWRRLKGFVRIEWAHQHNHVAVIGSKRAVKAERAARAYIGRVFADRPDLKEKVTPKYVFSGKRRVVSDDYYPALLRDNVELVDEPVAAFTETGIVTADGNEHPVDVVVAAIGYKASEYLSSIQVTGRDGLRLRDVWKEAAYAFYGLAVPGFPNLFIVYGPNTNGGGPITTMMERQADFIAAEVKRIARRHYTAVEVSSEATEEFRAWMQNRLKDTAWARGNNYFKAPNGQIVTQWLDGSVYYGWLIRSKRKKAMIGTRGARKARTPEADG